MGSALTQSVANPFYGHGGAGVIGTAKVQASQLLLPYPTYSAINQLFDDNNKAKYYSLVVKAQKNFSKGMSLLSTLTWSRNWDEAAAGPGNTLNSRCQGPAESLQHGGGVRVLEHRYAVPLVHRGHLRAAVRQRQSPSRAAAAR